MRTKFLKGAALDEGVFFCREDGEALGFFRVSRKMTKLLKDAWMNIK
jgi:hypothetical protein